MALITSRKRRISRFGTQPVPEPLRLNDSDIKRVTNTKSLGIIVDEGLNWERQYNTVHNNSRGSLQPLRMLQRILPQSSFSNV